MNNDIAKRTVLSFFTKRAIMNDGYRNDVLSIEKKRKYVKDALPKKYTELDKFDIFVNEALKENGAFEKKPQSYAGYLTFIKSVVELRVIELCQAYIDAQPTPVGRADTGLRVSSIHRPKV